jgi:hypothetical protein
MCPKSCPWCSVAGIYYLSLPNDRPKLYDAKVKPVLETSCGVQQCAAMA